MSFSRTTLITLFVLAAALPAAATDLTPMSIVADPSSYDGKSVSVAGTVAKYRTSKTLQGTVAAFQLCDYKCIVAIEQTITHTRTATK